MAGVAPLRALVMASSTGGPVALEQILSDLGPPLVPVVIVQHISSEFSKRLAARLNNECGFGVREATDGLTVRAGEGYLCPGDRHIELQDRFGELTVRLTDSERVNSCRPSADVLFSSAADVLGNQALGVILTGIGHDGRDGCRRLAASGATVLAQDEASSVVWGMPGSVVRAGSASEVLGLDAMGGRLRELVARSLRGRDGGYRR